MIALAKVDKIFVGHHGWRIWHAHRYKVAVSWGGRKCASGVFRCVRDHHRSEEHTSELQSLMRISYAVFCLKKKKNETFKNIQLTNRTLTYYKDATIYFIVSQ